MRQAGAKQRTEREQSTAGVMAWELPPFLCLPGQREAVMLPEPARVTVRALCAGREAGRGPGNQ